MCVYILCSISYTFHFTCKSCILLLFIVVVGDGDGGSRDGGIGIDIIKPFVFFLNINDLGQATILGAVGGCN